MRRFKMLLMSAVLTVAMLVALAGPAMADDFCCGGFGSPVVLGDGDVVFLLADEDLEEDLEDAFEDALDDGRVVFILDDDFRDGILFV